MVPRIPLSSSGTTAAVGPWQWLRGGSVTDQWTEIWARRWHPVSMGLTVFGGNCGWLVGWPGTHGETRGVDLWELFIFIANIRVFGFLICIIAREIRYVNIQRICGREKERGREERDNRETMDFDSFWFDLTGGEGFPSFAFRSFKEDGSTGRRGWRWLILESFSGSIGFLKRGSLFVRTDSCHIRATMIRLLVTVYVTVCLPNEWVPF